MQTMRGIVTIVQESRFQLWDEHEVSHLFLTARRLPVESFQLAELQRRKARVEVSYTKASNLMAFVAHKITVCDGSGLALQ